MFVATWLTCHQQNSETMSHAISVSHSQFVMEFHRIGRRSNLTNVPIHCINCQPVQINIIQNKRDSSHNYTGLFLQILCHYYHNRTHHSSSIPFCVILWMLVLIICVSRLRSLVTLRAKTWNRNSYKDILDIINHVIQLHKLQLTITISIMETVNHR